MAKSELQKTIQNYYNVGALMDESDLQMLSWMEELRDLRKILRKKEPQGDEGFENIEEAISCIKEEYDATGETVYKQHLFWLKQLKKARKRIGAD